MKQLLSLLVVSAFMVFLSCNNTELPPVVSDNQYVNPYAGTYRGIFNESYTGVDSNGVFKNLDSFEYDMIIQDAGNLEVMIQKGIFVFDNLPVDASGTFSTDSLNNSGDTTEYSVSGQFRNDSLYIEYKAINGGYNYPQWFTIVQLNFRGKKMY